MICNTVLYLILASNFDLWTCNKTEKCSYLSMSTKVHLYQALVMLVVTYGDF